MVYRCNIKWFVLSASISFTSLLAALNSLLLSSCSTVQLIVANCPGLSDNERLLTKSDEATPEQTVAHLGVGDDTLLLLNSAASFSKFSPIHSDEQATKLRDCSHEIGITV